MDEKSEIKAPLPKLTIKLFFSNLDNFLGTIFAFIMVILLVFQVLFRFVFNNPLTWTEELAVVFFIVSSYFGVSASIPRGQQIRINILTEFLPQKGKHIFALIANFFTIVFAVVISYGLFFVIEKQYTSGGALAITRFPKYIIYCVLPLCFLLFVIRIIIQSVQIIKEYRNGESKSVDDSGTLPNEGGDN